MVPAKMLESDSASVQAPSAKAGVLIAIDN